MKRLAPIAFATIGALLISACASVPNAQIKYFQPVSEAEVKLSVFVACNDNKQVFVERAPSLTSFHMADRSSPAETLSLKKYTGALSDLSIDVKLLDDGRLSSINTVSTGRGEVIITSALGVVTKVLGAAAGPGTASANDRKTVCDAVVASGTKKVITLNMAAASLRRHCPVRTNTRSYCNRSVSLPACSVMPLSTKYLDCLVPNWNMLHASPQSHLMRVTSLPQMS